MKLHAAVLATTLICGTAWADNGDLTQWRGPNRDGLSTETGLLKEWPKGGPKLLWKITGIGEGLGTVSTLGDLGYIIGDVGGINGECKIFAFNLKDGKIAWSSKVGRPRGKFKPGQHDPGARSTPTLDDKRVWALGAMGDLVCFDAAKGRKLWEQKLDGAAYEGKVGPWKYSESPLLDGSLIVCTPGGKNASVVAFKKDTGTLVWKSSEALTDKPIQYTSLAIAEIGGVRQYICMTMDSVSGVAAKNGKVLWKTNRGGRVAICSTPLYKDGIVFVSSGYGVGHNAYQVTAAGGKFSVKEIYSGKELENHHGGMIILGDHVYGLDEKKGMTCLELKTGKLVWQEQSVGKGATVYADGHFVVRGENVKGEIALVEASPKGYKEKGRFSVSGDTEYRKWTQPAIAGGRMFIRDHDALYCYDVKAK